MNNRPPPPPSEQPALAVEARHLDFGEVWETDRFEWTLPVRNPAPVDATVSASESSCGCVAPMATAQLPAGGAAPLKVQIDLRQQCANAEPQAVRDAKIRLTLSHTTPEGTQRIPVELRGRVKSAITGVPRLIDFGRFPATASVAPRVVSLRSLVNLRELTVSTDSPAVGAELKSLDAGRWELHVRPQATTVVGRHTANVTLTPVAAGSVPPIALAVQYDVLHDIQPDAPLVLLGTGQVGETLTGTLTVRSLSGRPFSRPTCEGAGVSVQIESAAPAGYTFRVSRAVTSPGDDTVPILVRGHDAPWASFEVRVAAHWYGVSP